MNAPLRLGRIVRLGGLPILWGITAVLMAWDYHIDRYDPALHGVRGYGHNRDGQLADALLLTAVELAVVMLILRPWSYQRSWMRAALALLLAIPWAVFSFFMLIHAGGVIALHFLWVVALILVLLVLSIVAAIGRR